MYSMIIVDDEPWVLKGIKNSCDWSKYNCEVVFETTEPEDALNFIINYKPDIIFTDINMYEVSGLDIMHEVRKQGIDAEFIIISGYSDFSYAQKSIEYGVFHYLLKPIDKDDINNVMEKLINHLKYKQMNKEHTNDNKSLIKTDTKFTKILKYIDEHYDENISLNDLSVSFHYNSNYICELFKKNLSKTFSEYLVDLRMKKACELLVTTDDTIMNIASQVGYGDYSYFSKIFKKHCGTTPLKYRKNK